MSIFQSNELNRVYGMANNVNPDQMAPLGLHYFTMAYLFKYL